MDIMESSYGSAPTTTSAPSTTSKMRKNASGARTDPGWKHGLDMHDRKVKCKFCNSVCSGGIFRFKHHLARTRNNVAPCDKVPENVRLEFCRLLEENDMVTKKKRGAFSTSEDDEVYERQARGSNLENNVTKKGKVQSTMNSIFKKEERERVCQQIARFFYTSAIPFNCVKNPEFRKMIEMIGEFGRGLNPPSYHEIRVTMLKKEVDYTKSLMEDYKKEWKKTGCTLMSDGWSDRKNRSICNFLVNSPRGTIFLASIDTSDIIKTKEKVFAMLDDFVEKIGEENVVQVVTDNAANYKAAGEMLMQKRKKLFWTPCAAHCIDLMLEDFEKKIEEHKVTITKGRKITSFIYNRSRLICLLKEFTKGKELLRPGATRFATSYLTLGRLFELKSALISFFASEKWLSTNYASTDTGKDVEDIVMDTAGFWSSVITCLRAAKPLMKVLRLVDSDSKPAMGFIYQAMVNAKKEIKANFKDIQTRYVPIYDIIDDRWYNQMNRAQHVAGYYLNPQMQYSDDFENNGWIKSGLYMCLERICGADENLAKTIDCQFDQFTNARGHFGLNVAKLTRKEKSPVDWWDSYGDDTPELKNFAMRILSLTCSSSGCERNWSAFEMVHSKRRNRLQQQKMNDLVYVMYNLKLNGRDENKGKGHDGLETLNLDDVSSDDEWITEEPSSIHDVNDDDDFLERAIRDQLCAGDRRDLGEDILDLEEEDDLDAQFVMLD
uniref:BED-type domain-containing protein n=1 Tax=Lactuca sativa TaxID=4236 RepID=A0A9R1UPZ9_LACSA|nr:hypothetical protein LSAT_V11C800390750 [Lactuca sativa]